MSRLLHQIRNLLLVLLVLAVELIAVLFRPRVVWSGPRILLLLLGILPFILVAGMAARLFRTPSPPHRPPQQVPPPHEPSSEQTSGDQTASENASDSKL